MGAFKQRNFRGMVWCALGIFSLFFMGCRKNGKVHTAFYSWKTVFQLTEQEAGLLSGTGTERLYLRFFDVVWNAQAGQALPNGVLTMKQPVGSLKVTPVVYVTNQSLENSKPFQMDSLAIQVNQLLIRMAGRQHLNFSSIQIDCDWTVGTRIKYFAFLKALKKYSHKNLEATIRLHQVKYPERTGVPPVDKGVLMFYNMGKISADLQARNSIYNHQDAAAYIAALPNYHLPLDVALPLFSWAIQIRGAKIVQLYAKISAGDLANQQHFLPLTKTEDGRSSLLAKVGLDGFGKHTAAGNAACTTFQARESFYLKGIYVKKGDLFKFEGMDAKSLNTAAKQLATHLAPLENRNIIYYEISSTNLLPLYAKDIKESSAHF